ncbi:signal peptidase II [Immundisolibacter sp.]|uniref:signal peptidase II n=1 Tax=Immundisolibacter sp. TaxID=1934948 RepID=UPI00260A4BE1|nr:signal peptidase II [Immundisolibacter sp.]MDD3650694.1 signal peptidase II [Immundisolibacter sp.]
MMRGRLGLAALVVVLDQASKFAVLRGLQPYQQIPLLPGFNLTLVFNRGASFSLLADAGGWQRWLFAGLAVLAGAAIVLLLRRTPPADRCNGYGLALVLGGAIGNLIDRIWLGQVIDFLDLYYGAWHWPAFNLADSAITVGAALLLLGMTRPAAPRKAVPR